ncbi:MULTISPECIES: GspE/PulE family protein [Xanthomonas]|uniref:GspE/PulE family protein n=1 Tax=Xanthomonas TaxID=338 RepID=UPI00069C8A9D|nr:MULTISPECIES: ATPase, T2SS/T4P/T4SS family [Xanthomonas]
MILEEYVDVDSRAESVAQVMPDEGIAQAAHEVLSAIGGVYPAPKEIQQFACLIRLAGRVELHVVPGHESDLHFAQYEEELHRARVRYTEIASTAATIAELHSAHKLGGGGADAKKAVASHAVSTDDHENQRKVITHLTVGHELGASDLHYTIDADGWRVQVRVNGEIEASPIDGGTNEEDGWRVVRALFNAMLESGGENFTAHKPQDGRLKQSIAKQVRLYGARVATRPLAGGYYLDMRLLFDSGVVDRTLMELGYLEEQAAILTQQARGTHGCVNFLAGATNSGKSTTLKVILSDAIRYFCGRKNVLTLENPVEYRISGAKQSYVINDDWLGGIRNFMRLDPDVVMVGEVRDEPSATAALRLGLTGHMTWTTIHANDAPSALQRLGDMGVDKSLLFDEQLVACIVAQSLVPRLCDECKVPWHGAKHRYGVDLVQRVEEFCNGGRGVYTRGAGCSACRNQGTAGRTVIAEVMMTSLGFMRLFQSQGKAAAMAHWIRSGGVSKCAHLAARIADGWIDPLDGETVVGSLAKNQQLLAQKYQ